MWEKFSGWGGRLCTHPGPQENVQEVQVPPALDLLSLFLVLQGGVPFPDDLVWAGSTGCCCLGTRPLPEGGTDVLHWDGSPRGREELD